MHHTASHSLTPPHAALHSLTQPHTASHSLAQPQRKGSIGTYISTDVCYSCNKPFDNSDIKGRNVRDHCRCMGRFLGAMHSLCNLKMRDQQTIPVIFHNLKGYDVHLFIKRLTDVEKGTIS